MKKELIHRCDKQLYLTRWILLQNKFFKLMYHIFHISDDDVPHDHPWNFMGIVLWGRYTEQIFNRDGKIIKVVKRGPLSFAFRPAETIHRVVIDTERVYTLIVTFKRIRRWGFWKRGRWIYWKNYESINCGEE